MTSLLPRATAIALAIAPVFSIGCASGNPAQSADDAGALDATSVGTDAVATAAAGHCDYTNPFSHAPECKSYTGAAWTSASAATDCASVLPGAMGAFTAGTACVEPSLLGTCVVTASGGLDYTIEDPGADPTACSDTALGCADFAKGTFTPGNTCVGVVEAGTSSDAGDATDAGATRPFVQPYRVCKAPLAGEPAGQSAGGQVCTWTLISGCTEAGRHFEDYASCDDVRTNRPYYASPPNGVTATDDPRLSDTAYMTEVAWARTQVEAAACVCCHSSKLAPAGTSEWFVESPGIWLDSVTNSGLAMMAGLAKSDALGAYPSADNNGFDRTTLGLPTTDVARMQKLLLGEWQRRGLTDADAAKVPPFGGPLVDQQSFVPSACATDQGQDATGALVWTGGDARYLYVLAAGSKPPIVPPNLDTPTGSLWIAQVPWNAAPFASGVTYGAVTGAMTQRLPATGAAPALVSGTSYYLYVLQDVGVPLTRCLFTAR